MKLQSEIGDKQHEIELIRSEDKISAVIDGELYQVEVSEPEPYVYLIKRDGRVYEAFVAPNERFDQPKVVTINKRDLEIRLIDPKRLRASTGSGEQADGLAEIRTAMPGKVARVLVETGSSVEKGDGVVVVEAMKMQNELKTPKAGIVKEIRAEEGATVSAGDILATIE